MKKDEFVSDCSDIDDIIVFRNDGYFLVTRIAEKTFVGKDIIHVAVWKKNDERTTYNAVYTDGASAKSFVKRFNVTAITRDKEYPITQETKGSKLHYFSVNPNGEAEVISDKRKVLAGKHADEIPLAEYQVKDSGKIDYRCIENLVRRSFRQTKYRE